MKKIVLAIFLIINNIALTQNELKHTIYFDTGAYNIPSIEKNRLLIFINNLDSLEIEKISIYGFCDDIGSDAFNLKLSQQRADAIKKLLSNNEIDDSKISNVDGKGEILLNIENTKDINNIRGLHRRADVVVFYKPYSPKEIEKTKRSIGDVLKVGDKIVLENILFKRGYSTIIPESKQTLVKLAQILKEKNNIYFTIQGHVCCTKNTRDAVDSETKKQNLSLARAKYIYNYLAHKGVSKKRMKYVGMRRKFPLGGDPKFDRRVEILITYISDKKNN
jgi:outer membrane protein OmpA-like peptidoglycan-associated protein